jgi:hypothetical protein
MRFFTVLFFLSLGYSTVGQAQKINASYRLNIQKASSPIAVDGKMDEKTWKEAEVASNFFMITPMDTSFSKVKTEVRMSYDEEQLYLYVINYHASDGPYMVEPLS